MDRASAIIMGFVGVVLLSIAALFWVLTSGDAGDNEAVSLLQTRATVADVGSVRTTAVPSTTVRDRPSTPTAAVAPGPSLPTSSSSATAPTTPLSPTNPASTNSGAAASPALSAILARVKAGGIRFEYRSDDLGIAANSLLDELALQLQREATVRLTISGHTDAEGLPDDNAALSARRAAAVVDHLVAVGIDANRLEIRAAGQLEPIADNDSVEGRSANRRVEIELQRAGR